MPKSAAPSDGIAWVTGASTGIGRATALELVTRGWRVAVSARKVDALADLVSQHPQSIFAFPCDVTDIAGVATTIDRIEAEHGAIALAYLNAGISIHNQAPDLELGAIHRIFETNVLGVYNAASPLIARMAARKTGQVAICASVAGYGGLPGAAAYCASKAAMISTAVSLAMECRPLGILVQCVNPGFVETPLTQKNKFKMPFLMKPEAAARRIVDGFARGGFEITFPRRMAWALKLLNLLPYPVYIALVGRGVRR